MGVELETKAAANAREAALRADIDVLLAQVEEGAEGQQVRVLDNDTRDLLSFDPAWHRLNAEVAEITTLGTAVAFDPATGLFTVAQDGVYGISVVVVTDHANVNGTRHLMISTSETGEDGGVQLDNPGDALGLRTSHTLVRRLSAAAVIDVGYATTHTQGTVDLKTFDVFVTLLGRVS